MAVEIQYHLKVRFNVCVESKAALGGGCNRGAKAASPTIVNARPLKRSWSHVVVEAEP